MQSVLALGLTVAVGCSGGASKLPEGAVKTHPVTGTVTLDGQPLANATVTFQAPAIGKDGKPAPSATGQTDANGKFRLTTYRDGDGAAAETYLISVMKSETPPTTPAASEAEYVPPEAQKGNTKAAAPKWLVPEKYTSPAKSGLTYTVKEGSNEVPLELKSK